MPIGTGKTALINFIYQKKKDRALLFNYIDIRDSNSTSEMQNFASNFCEKTTLDDMTFEVNFSNNWELFIVKTIVYYAKYKNKELIKQNNDFKKIYALLYGCYGDNYLRIIPRYKKGSFEILNKNKFLEEEFQTETLINAKAYYKKIYDLFYKLKFNNEKGLYLIFDELNISLSNPIALERQKLLIESLIKTISRLNKQFKDERKNIFIISSFRSEIKNIICGDELNKKIVDYGIELKWNNFLSKPLENPLIKLMLKRFIKLDSEESTENKVWEDWFSKEKTPEKWASYILKYTWKKPRDLILLFIKMKEKYGNSNIITKDVMRGSLSQYAIESWAEIKESLTIECKVDEINFITKVIINLKNKFYFTDFVKIKNKILSEYSNEFKDIKIRDDKYYLELMYRYGIIGIKEKNISEINYFHSGKNYNILNNEYYVVHLGISVGRNYLC